MLVDVNPVFDAPADLEFAQALGKVADPHVHYGLYQDETRPRTLQLARQRRPLPGTWGDVRTFDGTATIQQPLIAPLYGGKSADRAGGGVGPHGLGDWAPPPAAQVDQTDALELVKATSRVRRSGQVRRLRRMVAAAVRAGVVPDRRPAAASAPVKLDDPRRAGVRFPAGPGLDDSDRPDRAYDGRFANNGWLQELPKPSPS